MPTVVLDVGSPDRLAHALDQAAEVLRRGGLVAFPTETVYGLGANALDADAVRRIFTAKGRPANNPLIVHVADTDQVAQVAQGWPVAAAHLSRQFWPGPLTLVLPRRAEVPDVVTAGGPTVAVRVPAHPVALELIRAAGVPVAAPSANRSNRLSPTRAEHVLRDLGGEVELILDGGPTPGGIESTVVDVTSSPPRLLRPGLIEPSALEAVIGLLLRGETPIPAEALPSPGMLTRHYAPRTPLECVGGGEERVRQLLASGRRVAWVTWFDPDEVPAGAVLVRLPGDPVGYAAQLYAALHALDDGRFDHLVVAQPPEADAWLAIRDRLRRASA